MIEISLANLIPQSSVLAGAVLGEAHAEQIEKIVTAASRDRNPVVLFSFEGIDAVTPSYLKRILVGFQDSGKFISKFLGELEPLPLFTSLDTSVKEDIDSFLLARRWPGVVVESKARPIFSELIGFLEEAPKETFRRLCLIARGSAIDVMKAASGTQLALSAWNNRLAELLRLRLVRKEKVGRLLIFTPTVEVANG